MRLFAQGVIVAVLVVIIFTSNFCFAAKDVGSQTSLKINNDYVPGELLVKFKANVSSVKQLNLRARVKTRVRRSFSAIKVEHWRLAEDENVEQAITALKASGLVEYAEPNYRRYPRAIPIDPGFPQQWALRNTGQFLNDPVGGNTGITGADMDLMSAWDVTTGDRNVVVAIIDDSFNITHPDLQANIWVNTGETADDGLDNDGNGYVDDITGWNFVENNNNLALNPNADPPNGHGTVVAGAVGAVGNNGVGIAGVAWQVSIMPLRFGFDIASEVQAIQYAIDNGADIMSISFGGVYFSQAEQDAVNLLEQAGILLVVAAGNNEMDNDRITDYPSGFANTNIIAIAASTPIDNMVSWSQYGQTSVDVAAPGKSLYLTMDPGGSMTYGNSSMQGRLYDFAMGTSFSAPYVAGVAALIKSRYPQAGFLELKGRIMGGVDPLSDASGILSTDGRVNANTALTMTARPVLIINNVLVNDSSGNGNGIIEAGETADLSITLKNDWQDATGIQAVLTTSDVSVSIKGGTSSFPDMLGGGNGSTVTPFQITLAETVKGHRRMKFSLNITAAGGYADIRTFWLETGLLENGVKHTATISVSPQDDFHYYEIEVPANTAVLTIDLTSEVMRDLDLLAKFGGPPLYVVDSTGIMPLDNETFASAGAESNESLTITSPKQGTYHVTVFNFDLRATQYTIKAESQLGNGNSSSGGGAINPLLLACMLVGGFVIILQRKASRHS